MLTNLVVVLKENNICRVKQISKLNVSIIWWVLQAVFNCEAIEAKDLLPPFMAQILDNIRVVCFVDKIEYSRLLFGLILIYLYQFLKIEGRLFLIEG